MSEQKIWVEKLPKSCDECPCHSIMEDRCVLLRKQAIEPFLQSCPLKSLKTHDRALVRQVCEKIMHLAKLQNNDNFYIMIGCIIDEIRKEYEK